MALRWQFERQSPAHANFGNANQWTVGAGLTSLARETAQNSNDAALPGGAVEIVYTLIRLTGDDRRAFENALGWETGLKPHLDAMRAASRGAVSANQLIDGMESLRHAESLVLLRVADYGCRGLGGPEFADGDPDDFRDFVKLCRLDLFSGKDAAAGGSFGLGKAVYWRFSRLQTALFGSRTADGDGRGRTRLFGVQQGVSHHRDGVPYQGRGHFGVVADGEDLVRSHWADDELVAALHLSREDDRPGTSALIVGFFDPEDPTSALDGRRDLTRLATELRQGIEESFWPALARGRMSVRIDVVDDGVLVQQDRVDAEETFTELVGALRAYDEGRTQETLEEVGDVVVRDVPIRVPRRRRPDHPAFEHTAKLVVTLSDDLKDSLENQVCLFRRPEMVVETLTPPPVEGAMFHAFLLAGGAKDPDSPTVEDLRADDFLRHAEPPPHDRWIPRSGRKQVSQVNLNGVYVAPWRRNLTDIELDVARALQDLFGPLPPPPDTAPLSVLKHLRFLRGQPGEGGGRGPAAPRKPTVTMDSGWVEDGRWVVDFTVRAQNRDEGWAVVPELALVGLDGSRRHVAWDGPLEVLSREGGAADGRVFLPAKANARVVKTLVRGVSTADLPIPAEESAVEVVLGALGPAPVGRDA